MSYKKKKDTELDPLREYPSLCEVFHTRTLGYIEHFPHEWELSKLKPLYDSTQMIKSSVIKANAVYIDTKAAKEEQIAAYKTRDALLEEALREFRCFDSNFRTLMELSNFKARELHRIKLALLSIIEKEKEANPDIQKIDINVSMDKDNYIFTSINGTDHVRIKFTAQQRKTWLAAEAAARDAVSQRLSEDRKIIKRLSGS